MKIKYIFYIVFNVDMSPVLEKVHTSVCKNTSAKEYNCPWIITTIQTSLIILCCMWIEGKRLKTIKRPKLQIWEQTSKCDVYWNGSYHYSVGNCTANIKLGSFDRCTKGIITIYNNCVSFTDQWTTERPTSQSVVSPLTSQLKSQDNTLWDFWPVCNP